MDDYIRKVKQLIEDVPKNVSSMRSKGNSSSVLERLIQHDGKSQIVSQSETHAELGHPSVPSAALVLHTKDRHLIHDGHITRAGNELDRIEGGRYSFAQILLLGGTDLDSGYLSKVRRAASAVGKLDGCMVRLMEDKIWVRVSYKAVRNGLSFHVWGEHLIQTIRDTVPAAESVEVLFLLGMDDQVREIMELATTVGEQRREELLERVKERTGKDYDCDNPFDCDECPDRTDCDVLKDVANEVKKKNLGAVASNEGGD